ncbi:MAG: hypothetical protein J6B51_09850 [Clostridia bacterium]|nr:hypothetical protein [Clostridia bacterium]MBO5300358.1 hypothetical protein [Clostridia bacterium]
MRFIRAALYLIIIAVIAGWLALTFCEIEIEARDEYVRSSLAQYGISVRDTDYAKDTLSLYINSDGEKVTANDIMNIRKLLNALRCIVFEENIYNVSLVSPSGKTVYSTLFYNIYTSSEQAVLQYSGGTYDEVMKKYFLKYDLRNNGYECPYIGFYDTIGLEDPALYLEIGTSPEDLADAVSDFINYVTELNEEGSRIFRYSAAFYNGDDIMAVVSRDIIYGDVVYWKAPDYSAIRTMFG